MFYGQREWFQETLANIVGLDGPPLTQTSSIAPSDFTAFFKGKVDRICTATAGAVPVTSCHSCSSTLTSYSRVAPNDITQLLRHCPNKQCALDLLPTWIVKACSAEMSTIIAKLTWTRTGLCHAINLPTGRTIPLKPRCWKLQWRTGRSGQWNGNCHCAVRHVCSLWHC